MPALRCLLHCRPRGSLYTAGPPRGSFRRRPHCAGPRACRPLFGPYTLRVLWNFVGYLHSLSLVGYCSFTCTLRCSLLALSGSRVILALRALPSPGYLLFAGLLALFRASWVACSTGLTCSTGLARQVLWATCSCRMHGGDGQPF